MVDSFVMNMQYQGLTWYSWPHLFSHVDFPYFYVLLLVYYLYFFEQGIVQDQQKGLQHHNHAIHSVNFAVAVNGPIKYLYLSALNTSDLFLYTNSILL